MSGDSKEDRIGRRYLRRMRNESERTLQVETGTRTVRVSVQTRDFRAEGILEVPAGGYRGRLLDYLNGAADYLALTDVFLWETGREAVQDPVEHDVLLLRRSAIEFVIPLYEPR